FDIKQPIFYAEVYTELVLKLMSNQKVTVTELPKYPEVRRDLALLVNNKVRFVDLKETALKLERKLIKSINLFDVYEGKNLAKGKKSYAMSFTLRDDNSTLTDDRVDKVMKTIINSFQKQFEAELR